MTSTFNAALSGLRAHRTWIDVIGNNIANSNTVGFKGSRATFATAFSDYLAFGSAPTGSFGGTNPSQVGNGVGSVRTLHTFQQGALTATGRALDLSLEGNGFFTLATDDGPYYSRVGTFGLDVENNLVDLTTGHFVADPSGNAVNVEVDALFPPNATSNVVLEGNLPALVTGPLAEVLGTLNAYKQGTPASITSTIAGPDFAGIPNATYSMGLSVAGMASQSITVTADAAGNVTAADVAAAIDAADGVSAQVVGGQVQVQSQETGSDITMSFNAGAPNDLTALVGMPTSLFTGTEDPATGATALNDLTSNVDDYVAGDVIQLEGVDTDGTAVNATFVFGAGNDGTTLGDLVTFLDSQYADATVSLDSAGQLLVTAQTAGEAELLLSLSDATGGAGQSDWIEHSLSVSSEGTGPDEVVVTTEAYDSAGVAHTLTLTYERQPNLSWNVIVSMPDDQGDVLSGGASDPITGLTFDENGAPTSLGGVNTTITVQFAGQASPQTIDIDMGSDGEFDGLTQFGTQDSLLIDSQDGYSDGSLSNLSVDEEGQIIGFYTNNQQRSLGQVGIASFTNQDGLLEVGDNLFQETVASGDPRIGLGATQGRARVVSGALEESNVDTAEQTVRLIEAQRGFQANARVISVMDELIAEVTNLI